MPLIKHIINNLVNRPLWVGRISHTMNIFFYHKQNPSTNITQSAFYYNKLYVDNMFANITFASKRFPQSRIFLIEDGLNTSNLNLPNLTIVKQYKNLSRRHRDFLQNYFHLYSGGNTKLIMTFFERWFYVYEALIAYGIQNFIYLDSDCVLLEETTLHNYEKIGHNHPPCSEDCWPNMVMCSITNLNKFLDFICSFYQGVQQHMVEARQKQKSTPSPRRPIQESAGINYINSFFDKPRTGVCDMALWYLFKKQNPDLFINNLTIGHDDSVHDWGLGYDTATFTSQPAQKHDPQGVLQTVDIKQIFYSEDGPCFEEKDTKELIKIKSLHFSPGTLKFDIIPFIEKYEKIYGFPH